MLRSGFFIVWTPCPITREREKYHLAGWWGNLSRGSVGGSGEESEAAQVIFGPASLILDHALERFEGEHIAEVMEKHRHAPAIGMTVSLVAACLGPKKETVANQGGDDLSGGQVTQLAVVNGHRSEGDSHQRFLRDLHVFGNGLTVFQ